MEERKIGLPEVVEEVKTEICSEYCRYPFEISDEDELDKKCGECPLGRLGGL